MALVVTQQPQLYTPAYNPQWFTATSTNEAQPNHRYTIVVQDVISTASVVYRKQAIPGGGLIFDAMPFAEARVDNEMNQTIGAVLLGWQKAPGVRQIKVNIGETYGATPIYYAGTDINYYVWNACLGRKEFTSFVYTNYLYDLRVPRFIYFNGVLNDLTFVDRSNCLYVLNEPYQGIVGISVFTYNSAGVLLGTSSISNPYSGSANYREQYVCIDVGYKGLLNISSMLVGGTYPIITSSVARYDVYDNFTLVKSFTLGCENKYNPVVIHYLARNGAFLAANFNLVSEYKLTKDGTVYKQNPNGFSGIGYGYTADSSEDRMLDVSVQEAITLNTDWLSDDQINVYSELFTSSKWYIQDSSGVIRGVTLIPQTYIKTPHYKKKLIQLTMDFKYNYQDHAQRP